MATDTKVPTGDGDKENWGGSYTDVDDSVGSPNDTDYIARSTGSITSAKRFLFTFDDFEIPEGSTITSVSLVIRNKKHDVPPM